MPRAGPGPSCITQHGKHIINIASMGEHGFDDARLVYLTKDEQGPYVEVGDSTFISILETDGINIRYM